MSNEYTLKVPSEVLENVELKAIHKLIHCLTIQLSENGKGNNYSHKDVAQKLHISVNKVAEARKWLVENGYEQKQRGYIATDKWKTFPIANRADLRIPSKLLQSNLTAGAKLLWGEYNRYASNDKGYFRSRQSVANRLNCSVKSVSNWTTELQKVGLLKEHHIESAKGKKVRRVKTIHIDEWVIPTEQKAKRKSTSKVKRVVVENVQKKRTKPKTFEEQTVWFMKWFSILNRLPHFDYIDAIDFNEGLFEEFEQMGWSKELIYEWYEKGIEIVHNEKAIEHLFDDLPPLKEEQ